MEIAGYSVEVRGELPDADVVLIEDAVMLILGKLDGAELHAVEVVGSVRDGVDLRAAGYDLTLSYRGARGVATLRRDADGEWRFDLPRELERAVRDLPV